MIWVKIFILKNGLAIMLLLIAILLIYTGVKIKTTFKKQICFNLAAIFIGLFIFEIYLGFNKKVYSRGLIDIIKVSPEGSPISSPDKMLGYRLSDDTIFVIRKKLFKDSSLVYKAQYTIKNRIRVTPNSNIKSNEYLIFLGGSYMFGEGVDDDKTFPFFVNEYLKKKKNIINYAYSGYGLHQALSIVENLIINNSKFNTNNNTSVTYLFVSDHVRRAAGKARWDKHGPKYSVVKNEVIRSGNFRNDTILGVNLKYILRPWYNSNMYYRFKYNNAVSDYDIDKTVLMIKKMNDLLKVNNIRFNLIFDTVEDHFNIINPIIKRLANENIPTIKVQDIITDIEKKDKVNLYKIKGDGHPNEKYYNILAKNLVKLQFIN